ncbi:uncharacterized protein METZ01_LOCUS350010, partial [marine metagenome]
VIPSVYQHGSSAEDRSGTPNNISAKAPMPNT